jgi:hypothetical protein
MKILEHTEYINGKTVPKYKEVDGGIKMDKNIIDKDLVIDSLKSKIKYEQSNIEKAYNVIGESEKAIKKCQDQINKLIQGA